MVISNQERLAKALDILQLGLTPFVERELRSRLGKDWLTIVSREANITPERDGTVHWDVAALFKAMIGKCRTCSVTRLGTLSVPTLGNYSRYATVSLTSEKCLPRTTPSGHSTR